MSPSSLRLWLRILTAAVLLDVSAGYAQGDVFDKARESSWDIGGHAKYQFIYTRIPGDSVFKPVSGGSLGEHNFESRLKLSTRRGRWVFETHAQLIAAYSDRLAGLNQLPLPITGQDLINDDRRWFNLTHELKNEEKKAALLRLDRLSVGYTGEKTVLRFGRQAISWGNGLLFTPMDILNPFDPAAVDKEYKSGDDMLYAQHLLDNGNDFQAVGVVRRDLVNGEVESDKSSMAIKYHGFLGGHEYDLLAARHYGDDFLGLGFSTDFAGTILRGDLVWSGTDHGDYVSALAGVSYSGVISGRNWSGVLEYFYSGLGQSGGAYSVAELTTNPELVKRLARGELFNIAKHYLGASVTIELTPLVLLTPNLFVNLTDPSALAQLVMSYDWKQDIQVLGALNIPVGADGSEYGGLKTDQPGVYVSTGPSVFVQLAWYF